MGRRQRDFMDPASMDPQQLKSTPWRDSKVSYEDTSRDPTTRRLSPRSCRKNEVCSSRSSSGWTSVLMARRSEQNSARTKIWKMGEGGDYCSQRLQGGYQYWCFHFSGKCKQATKTFGRCGSGRTSGLTRANKSTCTLASLAILIWVLSLIDKDSWSQPSRSENKEAEGFAPQAF